MTGQRSGMPSQTRLVRSLFHDLSGTWHLSRKLQSGHPSEPSGRCEGKATFTQTQPSPVLDADGKLQLADAELLYHEEGEFEMDLPSVGQNANVPKFPFSRKYIWRLKESDDEVTMSIWFTKPGTNLVDYLFHTVDIVREDDEGDDPKSPVVLEGSGGHLCVDDYYSSFYTFTLSSEGTATSLSSWTMTHEVCGPKKDQVIKTAFTRPLQRA
ncbi:hypothetical protein PV08_09618 [Exophiala spinifera]|uniref:DUF6314 domain-containing protein n=1 Tax=Exophiala spinifera TaxID=91928 RepID=A0A0D1YBM0_9EURO|nr:uncharacterized protein PV08_09618 [Exophiala spinifera]KIW12341.1 hypothetical protein PV08_09618 [Exophiala spinifera]